MDLVNNYKKKKQNHLKPTTLWQNKSRCHLKNCLNINKISPQNQPNFLSALENQVFCAWRTQKFTMHSKSNNVPVYCISMEELNRILPFGWYKVN